MGGNGDVARLGDMFRDADFRRKFATDAEGATKEAGLDPQGFPEGVLETLGRCSEEELGALAGMRDKLKGLPPDVLVQIV